MVQKAGFCGENGVKEGAPRRFERICTMKEGENKDYHGKRMGGKLKLYHEEILKWTYHGKEQKRKQTDAMMGSGKMYGHGNLKLIDKEWCLTYPWGKVV